MPMVTHTNIVTGQVFERAIYVIDDFVSSSIDLTDACILLLFCKDRRLLSVIKCYEGVLSSLQSNQLAVYFDVIIVPSIQSKVIDIAYNNFMLEWAVGKSDSQLIHEMKNN